MIIAGCIAGMLLVGYTAWVELADDVEDAVVAIVGFATVTRARGCARQRGEGEVRDGGGRPAGLAVRGPVGVRLAKPRSFWARHRYGDAKMARARKRFPGHGGHDSAPDPQATAPATGDP